MNKQTNSEAVMRAALKMAIEALEWAVSNAKIIRDFPKDDVAKYANKTIGVCEDKIQACKEALAQPAQEPVAFVWLERDEVMPILELHGYTLTSSMYYFLDDLFSKIAEKNTHPAPLWQGLSDDDITQLKDDWGIDIDHWNDFARAIEQALKEKNI